MAKWIPPTCSINKKIGFSFFSTFAKCYLVILFIKAANSKEQSTALVIAGNTNFEVSFLDTYSNQSSFLLNHQSFQSWTLDKSKYWFLLKFFSEAEFNLPPIVNYEPRAFPINPFMNFKIKIRKKANQKKGDNRKRRRTTWFETNKGKIFAENFLEIWRENQSIDSNFANSITPRAL